jgi:hypothetical protein
MEVEDSTHAIYKTQAINQGTNRQIPRKLISAKTNQMQEIPLDFFQQEITPQIVPRGTFRPRNFGSNRPSKNAVSGTLAAASKWDWCL